MTPTPPQSSWRRMPARAPTGPFFATTMSMNSTLSSADSSDAALTLLCADTFLPAGAVGPDTVGGKWRELHGVKAAGAPPVPVVILAHGSSGLTDATREFQQWLAQQGVASVAPDSFARPNRLTYNSPAPKPVYEAVHAQRSAEIAYALAAVGRSAWADSSRVFLAGTSEGSVAVARWDQPGFAGRMIFSWSCEDNYFVDNHRTATKPDEPFLSVISLSDPYFSPESALNQGVNVTGHCGSAVAENKAAQIVLIPGAPHTLYNLPQVRAIVKSYLDLYAFGRH